VQEGAHPVKALTVRPALAALEAPARHATAQRLRVALTLVARSNIFLGALLRVQVRAHPARLLMARAAPIAHSVYALLGIARPAELIRVKAINIWLAVTP
jgi:hypothetical protein